MRRALVWFALLLVIAVPGVAWAQSTVINDESVLVAVDRDITVAAGESVGVLVVVSGNAIVSGSASTVVVVDGTLTVDGTVDDVVAADSDVSLAATAVVNGDVVIASGDLTRASGSTIGGSVTRNFDLRIGWALTVISILFWVGITLALMIAGLVLVAIARRQVLGVGELLSGMPGPSILATVILVIALPLAAIGAFISVIGIPAGLALLLVVLPLLWTGGYLVAGARVGRLVLGAGSNGESQVSPYLAVLLGVLLFQIVGLIPGLGGLVIVLAATYGAGGLALYAWRSWRSSAGAPMTPTA